MKTTENFSELTAGQLFQLENYERSIHEGPPPYFKDDSEDDELFKAFELLNDSGRFLVVDCGRIQKDIDAILEIDRTP